MLKWETKCPCCGALADAFTTDGRNMVFCPTCLYKSTLIEAIRLRNEKRAKETERSAQGRLL